MVCGSIIFILYAMIKVLMFQSSHEINNWEFVSICVINILLIFNCIDVICLPEIIRNKVLIPWFQFCVNQHCSCCFSKKI